MHTNCSNEKEVAKSITQKLFGKILPVIYYNETEIFSNNKILITIQLLNLNEINFKWTITIKIENNAVIDANWGGLIGNNIIRLLEKNFNFKIDDIKTKIVNVFSQYISHGNIEINFNCLKKKNRN